MKPLDEIMTSLHKTLESTALAGRALQQMEAAAITALFITPNRNEKRVASILDLHDILRAGLV